MARFRPVTSFLGVGACIVAGCGDEGYQREIEEPPVVPASSSGAGTTGAGETTGPAAGATTSTGGSARSFTIRSA